MNADPELRPCPFCGASGGALHLTEVVVGRFVKCDRCEAWGPLADRRDGHFRPELDDAAYEAELRRRAAELWNGRAPAHPP